MGRTITCSDLLKDKQTSECPTFEFEWRRRVYVGISFRDISPFLVGLVLTEGDGLWSEVGKWAKSLCLKLVIFQKLRFFEFFEKYIIFWDPENSKNRHFFVFLISYQKWHYGRTQILISIYVSTWTAGAVIKLSNTSEYLVQASPVLRLWWLQPGQRPWAALRPL